jgi:hypothetical protein
MRERKYFARDARHYRFPQFGGYRDKPIWFLAAFNVPVVALS